MLDFYSLVVVGVVVVVDVVAIWKQLNFFNLFPFKIFKNICRGCSK